MQQSKITNGVNVFFDPGELDTAQVIHEAAKKCLPLIQEYWGLVKPPDCRIYVMNSWWGFYFQSTPWTWRVFLVLTIPLWGFRARQMWPYSAAWTQSYSKRVVIGIKPPRLVEVSDKSIGRLLFVEVKDPRLRLQQVTCHELTHACAAHLRLPAWLNEGLAMATVDRLVGKRTIRDDSLGLLGKIKLSGKPPSYRQLSHMEPEAIAEHIALGYWLVRYLEETHPGFIKQVFTSTPKSKRVENEIAVALGIESVGDWAKIPERMMAHFERT